MFHYLFDSSLVFILVGVVDLGCLTVRGRVWVGVPQQGTNRGEDGPDIVDGTPLILKDVQTNSTVTIDVGMEEFGCKFYFGRLGGVLVRKLKFELE